MNAVPQPSPDTLVRQTLVDTNPKTAFGRAKPQLHAIPASALLALGRVMKLGEAKYGLTNWRHDPPSASVYYDAALRHLMSWWDGEDIDPESGAPHTAHVMACMGIVIDAHRAGTLIDDRPKPGDAAAYIAETAKLTGIIVDARQLAIPDILRQEMPA